MRFSAKEIIDTAIEIEDLGYHFYKKFSAKFKDNKIKEIFTLLADQEMEHKLTFQNILSELKDARGVFTEEYYQYLKAITQHDRVFKSIKDIDKAVKDIDSPSTVLSLALEAEKNSILFYSEIKDLYSADKEPADVLKKIIEEERKHVLTIVDLKEKYS